MNDVEQHRRRLGVTADRPNVGALPAVRWPESGSLDLVAEVPPAGLFLGVDRAGQPAALPAVRPRSVRVGVLGPPSVAGVLAYRLLAVGCQVTVVAAAPPYWRRLAAKVDDARLAVFDRPVAWPAATPGPPGVHTRPQVLIVDHPAALPRARATGAWCTVIHLSSSPPAGADFWGAVDAMVLTHPGHALATARRWHREDTPVLADIQPGEIALADQHGTRLVALLLTPGERQVAGHVVGQVAVRRDVPT